MKNNKIVLFPVLSRYPTEKAFGITTRFTAEAVQSLGYETYILAPKRGFKIESKVSTIIIGEGLHNKLLNNRIKILVNFRFSIFQIYYYFSILKKYGLRNKIFWTRDIFLSLLLSLQKSNSVVCEIHRTPSAINRSVLYFLKNKKNVLLAPITVTLKEKLQINDIRSEIAPMAINRKERENYLEHLKSKENKIIYLGNYTSGGHQLDLNKINKLAFEIDKLYPDWKFEIIGIERSVVEESCNEVLSKNISVLGRLSREQLIENLKYAKIGLVIYPNYEYFVDSFPIKIVEYAAAHLSIIASDTIAHRNLLNSSMCVFFSYESAASLLLAVTKVINDPKYGNEISRNAFNWSKELTYEKRVKNILHLLDRISAVDLTQ
jgi:hypothetical protein